MKKLAPALAALLLAACAANDYKPDLAGKPTATLRLSSIHPSPARAGALTRNCVPFTAKEFGTAAQGMGTLSAKQPLEQKVPAGAPFAVAFFTTSTTVSGQTATDANCAVGMRFTPEAGAEYEAVFAGNSEGCHMELGKLGAGSGARTTPVAGAAEIKGCE